MIEGRQVTIVVPYCEMDLDCGATMLCHGTNLRQFNDRVGKPERYQPDGFCRNYQKGIVSP